MKRFFVFSFLCLMLSLVANAQNYYRDYNLNSSGNGFTSIAFTENDEVLLSGTDTSGPVLLKADCNGDGIWARKFTSSILSYISVTDLAVTTDNEITMLVSFQAAPPIGTIGLVRMDALGNTLWAKYYDYSASNSAIKMIAVDDGAVLLVGGGCIGDNFLIKVDDQGNIIWSYQYSNIYGGTAFAVDLAANGDYLVGIWHAFEQGFGIMRIDPNGNLKWFKRMDAVNYELPRDIKEDAQGNIVMVGQTRAFNPTNKAEAFILKTDSIGNVLWTRTIEMSEWDEAMSVVCTEGGYIVGGTSYFSTVLNNQWLLTKFSSDGQWEWSTEFGNAVNVGVGGDEMYEINIRNGNDIYMVGRMNNDGFTLNKSDTLASMFCNNLNVTPTIDTVVFDTSDITSSINVNVLAFNTLPYIIDNQPISFMDNIICGSSPGLFCSAVSIADVAEQEEIDVYPNPSNGIFNLVFNKDNGNVSITIISMNGKVVYENNELGSHQLKVDASGWSSGVYVLKLYTNNKTTIKKLVVQ